MSNFETICEQLRTLRKAGLEDSSSYQRLSNLALDFAPDALKTEIMNLAVKEGRLPRPDGYDNAGEPVWILETIAKRFGLTDEEIKLSLAEFQEEHGAIQPIDTIHRRHSTELYFHAR